MKKVQYTLMVCLMVMVGHQSYAQSTTPKFSVNGAARSIFFTDNLIQDLPVEDTITPPRENSGHALVDLGINIRPADNIEIQGMVRIRNDFGGFWGAGVTFDVRQLYVKGVIKDVVRYQLGDINYQLTPYTFYNNQQELSANSPVLFNHLSDVVDYDNFYNLENSWRQQGAAVDFGFNFRSAIESVTFNLFTSRVIPTNLGSVNDRLFSAFNMGIVQSKYVELGLNYVSLYDMKGSSRNNELLNNPVLTGTAAINYSIENFTFRAEGEAGSSTTKYFEDPEAPELTDVFFDGRVIVNYTPINIKLTAGFKSVGPDFRSPGAQTKRINFESFPAAYDRITNDQVLRPLNMLDLVRETSLYNLQIQNGLMAFNPLYDNITPYGAATPNRQGFNIGLAYATQDEALELDAKMDMLTEVRGQGTTNLRSFNRMQFGGVYHIGKGLMNSNRLLDVSFNVRLDQTTRDADQEGIPVVDLSTNVIGAGIEAEIAPQFDIVAGIQLHSFSGFEFESVRDVYGQIVNFDELMADGSQQMYGAGIRFRFNEKVYLMAQWNSFEYTDASVETIPDYKINDLAMIFSMKF